MHSEKGTIAISLVAEAVRCVERCGADPLPPPADGRIAPHLLALPRGSVSSAQ